jgi:hypothetical protein
MIRGLEGETPDNFHPVYEKTKPAFRKTAEDFRRGVDSEVFSHFLRKVSCVWQTGEPGFRDPCTGSPHGEAR